MDTWIAPQQAQHNQPTHNNKQTVDQWIPGLPLNKQEAASSVCGRDTRVLKHTCPRQSGGVEYGEDPSEDRAYAEGVGLPQFLRQLKIAGSSRGNATKHREETAETGKHSIDRSAVGQVPKDTHT